MFMTWITVYINNFRNRTPVAKKVFLFSIFFPIDEVHENANTIIKEKKNKQYNYI